MRAQLLLTLTQWLDSSGRQPLFLGGMRGVGKTAFVEDLARRTDRTLARVPLADRPQLHAVFERGDPAQILRRIGALRGMPPLAPGCLLFLDDLCAVPGAATILPLLQRQLPDVPILCAGSPMRITRHCERGLMQPMSLPQQTLHPLTFAEFLEFIGETKLRQAVETWRMDAPPGERTHQRLLHEVLMYYHVGGLPDAVRRYQMRRDPLLAGIAQAQVLDAIDSDLRGFGDARHLESMAYLFDSYILRPNPARILQACGQGEGTSEIHFRKGLERLRRGGLAEPVVHLDAATRALDTLTPGLDYKLLAPDAGLMARKGNHTYVEGMSLEHLLLGMVMPPQFVGQELRAALPPDRKLLFWSPRTGASGAEAPDLLDTVDFVLEAAGTPVPVQTFGAGYDRSALPAFVSKKKVPLAVSLGPHPPSSRKVRNNEASYHLLSLPLYLAGSLPRILEEEMSR